jgi:hypothetical protein
MKLCGGIKARRGADYVAVRITRWTFEEADDLPAWWHEMMTTPIVAVVDEPVDLQRLRAFADLVSLPPL